MANTLSVMTNVLRNVVSKQRIRYKENGYNLDLAYICDNIIAMGYPADNIESIFRNRLEDVYKFLQEIHQNHYKIYNLCLERSYDSNKFHGRVAVYPFEDHNPPTIELIQRFCADVDTWLKADSQNVAAVHCKAGKGRTGTMICCYLLYSGQQQTAEDALECYAEKRTKDRKGVTIPSQRRYVQYFAKLIRSGVPYEKRILQFCEIRFTEANLLHSHGTVHCSISVLEDNGSSVKVMPLLGLPIDFRKSYTLDLKNHSLCVAGDIKVELTHKKKLFHFWFNTYFVRDDSVIEEEGEEAKLVYTLNKCEIDDAHKDKEHKCFSEGFKVQLVFYAENSMRPGLQANVSSIASQISNNQRKSQNARLSHQYSGGGGDSSSSSNCQLPQNSSSGSDLNYICDQKSSSSASASVSSFGGPLIGGSGGSGSIGDTSMGDAANAADYSCIEGTYPGTQVMHQLPPQYALQQQQQQQLKQRISVSYKQQYGGPVKSITRGSGGSSVGGGCDSYDCDADVTPFGGRISAATIANTAYVLPTQQQQQPQHTYVNLENIMPAADKQKHLQLQMQQQHELMRSLLTTATTTPNIATATPATVTATSIATNSFMLTTAIQQQNNAAKFGTPYASTAFIGGKSIMQHQQAPALQLGSNNSTNNSRRQADKDAMITTAAQSNGAVISGGGGDGCGGGGVVGEAVNGRVCDNSSKSSISSQSSSSASTTSSASSSVPTSAGDQDCEEEDWESATNNISRQLSGQSEPYNSTETKLSPRGQGDGVYNNINKYKGGLKELKPLPSTETTGKDKNIAYTNNKHCNNVAIGGDSREQNSNGDADYQLITEEQEDEQEEGETVTAESGATISGTNSVFGNGSSGGSGGGGADLGDSEYDAILLMRRCQPTTGQGLKKLLRDHNTTGGMSVKNSHAHAHPHAHTRPRRGTT